MILLWLVVAAVLLSPLGFWNGCCCGGDGTLNVTVLGCSTLPLPGLTVTITVFSVGTLVGSGTTDSLGKVSFTLPAGTYTITVPASRLNTGSTNVVVTSGGTTNSTLTLSNADTTNYVCTNCSPYPLKKVLNVTVGSNSFTISPTVSNTWQGTVSLSANVGCFGATSPGNAPFLFVLVCSSLGWIYEVVAYGYKNQGNCAAPPDYMAGSCAFQTTNRSYRVSGSLTGTPPTIPSAASGTVGATLTNIGTEPECLTVGATLANLLTGSVTVTE